MPSLKRKTSHVKESGFSIYTGEEPKAGVYKAEIINSKMKMSKNDNLYFNVFIKFAGNTGTKAEYDGWTGFGMITLGDKEALIQRERNFYRAVGASEDPAVVYEPIEKGGAVTKIDGKKIEGKQVLVSIRMEEYNGAMQPRVNDILPLAEANGARSTAGDTSDDLVEEDDDLLEEDEDAEDEDEVEEDDEESDEEDAEEVDEDDDEVEPLPRDQFEGLSIVKLKKKVMEEFADAVSKEDLKGLDKDEILEYLEEEGLITPF